MNEFLQAVTKRRSIYNLTDKSTISDAKLQELIETAVSNVPSAFNSQTSRVVLLIGKQHKLLWDITLNKLKEIVPENKFAGTKNKIATFAAGYGTILYFEEQETIEALQKNYPPYATNFPMWSQQSTGMLQFAIWTALEVEGIGASLQHYNPLIDDEVNTTFALPKSWKLIAQMPFGVASSPAEAKSILPIELRVKIFN